MVARAAEGTPVRVASASVLEIAYGFERRAEADPRYRTLLSWFADVLAAGAFAVVALDGPAAFVAGRLRAAVPHAPARRDRRSKTMRQASWLLDIQIAATAFAAGLDVATANRADFWRSERLSRSCFRRAAARGPRRSAVAGERLRPRTSGAGHRPRAAAAAAIIRLSRPVELAAFSVGRADRHRLRNDRAVRGRAHAVGHLVAAHPERLPGAKASEGHDHRAGSPRFASRWRNAKAPEVLEVRAGVGPGGKPSPAPVTAPSGSALTPSAM